MKELLYEKEVELNELRDKYIRDLESHPFTLGYALQLGFNNIYLRLPDGDRIEVGYLERVGDHLEYSGSFTDAQLAMEYELDEAYYDHCDYTGHNYTELVVKCKNQQDNNVFEEDLIPLF